MKIEIPKNEYRISITSACNMKCIYCHNEGNTHVSSLSKDDIDLLLANSNDINIKSVRLTGGEPTIHPEFTEIVKLVKDKYNLKVGVNTNAMNISKMVPLLKAGYIDRVVVGLDYFDGEISKNSPVGVSSKRVLENVLEMQKYCPNICVATVYSDNFEDIDLLTEFCLNNNIRIKIIEVVDNERSEHTSLKYLNLKYYISSKYNMDLMTSDNYFTQDQGFINGKRVASFYHSLHRLRDCKHCKNVNLRLSSDGEFRNCLMGGKKSEDFRKGENIKQNIEQSLEELIKE